MYERETVVFRLSDPADGFDFKLDEFFAAPSETFEPYYGECVDCGIVVLAV